MWRDGIQRDVDRRRFSHHLTLAVWASQTWDDSPIEDSPHLIVRPKDGAALTEGQLSDLARVAHAQTADLAADGSAHLTFPADRYSAQAARGNLEMAARMQLGARWHTRFEIVEG